MASNSWWLGAPGSQVCGTLVLACGIAVYKEEPSDVHTYLWSKQRQLHRENGGTLGMVPSIINPIYTIYKVGIYWVYPLLKGSLKRLKQLGYHPRVPAFSLWQLLFCTSSTAQGGGGSFKNRKRIGEIDCCEWRMSEQNIDQLTN